MDFKLLCKRAYNANASRGIYTPFYTKIDTIAKADEERAEYLEEVTMDPHNMSIREQDEMMDEILLRCAELERCGVCPLEVAKRVLKHNETRKD